MKVEKEEDTMHGRLIGIPREYDLLAFGYYPHQDIYFVFLVERGKIIKTNKKIEGVKYAEGGCDSIEILENDVFAFQIEHGVYNFEVRDLTGIAGVHFRLFPNGYEEEKSTYENSEVEVISLRYV